MAIFSLVAGINRLIGAAIEYEKCGFSVIPIRGDLSPEHPKMPAVDWKVWQFRRADAHQLTQWFSHNRSGGLALVTGSISRLLVLDFDSQQLADTFEQQYPELTHTRIVRSAGRGLPHYYYRLPDMAPVPSRRVPGLDLLADGRYVIASPTVIAGKPYELVRAGQPLILTNQQLQQILAFVNGIANAQATPQPISEPRSGQISAQQLVSILHQLAPGGRNQALFQVACAARDAGWSLQDTTAHLLAPFLMLPARDGSVQGSLVAREQEGLRTIASAFKRSPRVPAVRTETTPSLPTALREYLLQQGKVHLARVLDGLLLSGLPAHAAFTEKALVTRLQGIVGRHSIIKALQELDLSGMPVFAQENPSPTPPTHTFVASATAEETNNTCILFRATASNKNKRGRPPKTYLMPRIDLLCQRFGVTVRGADTLNSEDLRSPSAYRQAMQRELLRRRPGEYSVSWLAQRVGVSRRTMQRYQSMGEISHRPTYTRTLLGWSNLAVVPDELEFAGVFLEDDHGKRYPALRVIAARLLKQGRAVAYVRQGHNRYWQGEQSVPDFLFSEIAPKSRINADKLDFPVFPVYTEAIAQKEPENANNRPFAEMSPARQRETVPPVLMKPSSAPDNPPPDPGKRRYKLPLPDLQLETAALTLYERIRACCQERAGYLSKARARWLVERYGGELVKKALRVLNWREGIENPAGFVTVWLRSEALKQELLALAR